VCGIVSPLGGQGMLTHMYVRGKSPSGSVHPLALTVKLVIKAVPLLGLTLMLPPTGPRLTFTTICGDVV
jgi:hypothetical protein